MPFIYRRRRQPANAHWGKANSTYKLYGNIICLNKHIACYDIDHTISNVLRDNIYGIEYYYFSLMCICCLAATLDRKHRCGRSMNDCTCDWHKALIEAWILWHC